MADAQQIIQDMAKYSQVKKAGIFVRAGEALKGAVTGIFTERDKTREVSDIAIKDAPDSFPAEVKTSLENIKKSPIWKKETLEKLNPDYAKHIEQLGALINTHIEREAKIPGTKNAANGKYQEWMEAFSNYEKVVSEYSSYITLSAQVPDASVDKQKESLGITEMSSDRTELISAFAYMGIEITEKDGKFEYKEIEGGLPYQDSKGQTQYLRISTDAAKAFVENYFAEGSSTKKEENDLRLETEALENMRENLKKGGIDAPTPEDIKKQEKKVEAAQKALDAAKERTITPKGLFKYFIEQEIKGSTKKRNLDPQLITRAESMFHPDSPQWGAFSLNRDLENFNDDLALVGSLSLVTGEMQEFMETHEEVPQFDDFLTSGAADRFKTRRVVNRLENDAIDMHKEIGHTVEMTDLAIENIIEKYRVKVRGLEEKARLYENKKQPVPENVQKLIGDTNKMIEALELYGDVIKNIKEGLPKLSNVPEELKTNDTLLVKTITEKVKYDETLGRVVLSEDLVNDKGEVWLSKDQFLEFYNSRVLEARGMDPNTLTDVMESSLGFEVESGLTFEQIIANDAMQDRAINFALNPPNFIADMYAQFKEKKKQHPELTGQDFAKTILETQQGKDGAVKDELVIQGIASMDAIGRAFDACAEMEASGNTKDIDLSAHASTKDGFAKAQTAYYHMDVVAQKISGDPELREEYESASLEDKKKIFGRVYSELKNNNAFEQPTEAQLKAAVDRWRPYGLLSQNANMFKKLHDSPEFEDNERNLQTLTSLGKIVSQEEALLNSIIENPKPGQKTVAYEFEDENTSKRDGAAANYRDPYFKEMFPRGIPQFKIEKSLQPYNIKAGLKLLDQIMDAFNDVLVQDPWGRMVNKDTKRLEQPVLSSGSDGPELAEVVDGSSPSAGENIIPESPVFEGLDDNQVQNRVAMMAVGMGVNSILDQLKLGQDVDAPLVRNAMDYMTMMGPEDQPKVKMGDQEVVLSDAMQRVFINEFATGAKNAKEASASIDSIVAQLDPKSPLIPMVKSMSVLMGTLSPAEIVQMLSMTAETSAPAPGEPLSIELGSKLTKEDIAIFRQQKNMGNIRDMIEQSEMYDQATIDRIFEAGNEMRNPEAGIEII